MTKISLLFAAAFPCRSCPHLPGFLHPESNETPPRNRQTQSLSPLIATLLFLSTSFRPERPFSDPLLAFIIQIVKWYMGRNNTPHTSSAPTFWTTQDHSPPILILYGLAFVRIHLPYFNLPRDCKYTIKVAVKTGKQSLEIKKKLKCESEGISDVESRWNKLGFTFSTLPNAFATTRVDQRVVANLPTAVFECLAKPSLEPVQNFKCSYIMFLCCWWQESTAQVEASKENVNTTTFGPGGDVGFNPSFQHLRKPMLCKLCFSPLGTGMDHSCIAYLERSRSKYVCGDSFRHRLVFVAPSLW